MLVLRDKLLSALTHESVKPLLQKPLSGLWLNLGRIGDPSYLLDLSFFFEGGGDFQIFHFSNVKDFLSVLNKLYNKW